MSDATRANVSLLLQVATVILLVVLITQPGVARGPIVPIAPEQTVTSVCNNPGFFPPTGDCNQMIVDNLRNVEAVLQVVRNHFSDLRAQVRELHDDLTTLDQHVLDLAP